MFLATSQWQHISTASKMKQGPESEKKMLFSLELSHSDVLPTTVTPRQSRIRLICEKQKQNVVWPCLPVEKNSAEFNCPQIGSMHNCS